MMKKALCALLALLLMMSAAVAEMTMDFGDQTEELTVEEKLETALPVLNGLIRVMGVEGMEEYAPEDPMFVWKTLWQIAMTCNGMDPETAEEVLIYVDEDTMLRYAQAAFPDVTALPEIPANEGTIGIADMVRYDAGNKTYSVVNTSLNAEYQDHLTVDRYAETEDGGVLVSAALYFNEDAELTTEENGREGALTVKLLPVETDENTAEETEITTDEEEEVPFAPAFRVVEAAAETDADFEGLEPAECEVEFLPVEDEEEADEEDGEEPEPTKMPVPTKKPEPTYETLSKGSSGDAVLKLQNRLNELGYSCGTADGIFGKRAVRAVRLFQGDCGMTETGKADPATQKALYASDAPEYVKYKLLTKGSVGIRVEDLQTRLVDLGYMAGPVDGEYGADTVAAVKLFQEQIEIKADGKAGEKTQKSLNADSAPFCESYIDLRKGNIGIRVEELQGALYNLDYLDHRPSGTYDSETVSAVKAYMDNNGWDGNGKTAPAELVAEICNTIPGPKPYPTPEPYEDLQVITIDEAAYVYNEVNAARAELGLSQVGSIEDAIIALQKMLGVPATGVYNQTTYDAVYSFRVNYMVGPIENMDGIADRSFMLAYIEMLQAQ